MFETGCCGEDFRADKVTFVGLMTLSMPLIVLSAPVVCCLEKEARFRAAQGQYNRVFRMFRATRQ